MNTCDEIKKLIDKCKEEIEWAQANINEMNEKGNYAEDDKVWLPCWLKAHKEMLDIIKTNPAKVKELKD